MRSFRALLARGLIPTSKGMDGQNVRVLYGGIFDLGKSC